MGSNYEEILKRLHRIQYSKYSFASFKKTMKRRLRRWTGNDEAAFFTDKQMVEALVLHNVLDENGEIR